MNSMRDAQGLNLNIEGNLVREKWKNSGFVDDFDRIVDKFEVGPELARNLIYVGTASAIQQTFAEEEESWGHGALEPFNVRAIEVFTHAWEQYGDNAFETWVENPGFDEAYTFGDIDLYFPAGRETNMESRPCIGKIYEDRFGSNIQESANGDNIDGEKYTALLDFADSVEIEIDLMRPDINSESEYPMAQEEPHSFETEGGAVLNTPPLEESILHKGTLENDNGEGYDTMRDKDYKELATLFAIAEDRGIGTQHFENEYDDDDLAAIGQRTGGMQQVSDDWPHKPSEEYLSRIDQWTHIYSD